MVNMVFLPLLKEECNKERMDGEKEEKGRGGGGREEERKNLR